MDGGGESEEERGWVEGGGESEEGRGWVDRHMLYCCAAISQDYAHELVCVTEREKFVIPVRGIGRRGVVDFPDEIHFPTAPVKVSHVTMPTSLHITTVTLATYECCECCSRPHSSLSAVHFDKDSVDSKCWSSTRPLLPGDLKVSQCAVSVCSPRVAFCTCTCSETGDSHHSMLYSCTYVCMYCT